MLLLTVINCFSTKCRGPYFCGHKAYKV